MVGPQRPVCDQPAIEGLYHQRQCVTADGVLARALSALVVYKLNPTQIRKQDDGMTLGPTAPCVTFCGKSKHALTAICRFAGMHLWTWST